ncbi:MAG: hypothetical protein AWU57_290 [Marinobacter sp. T13-3]|nr:MAG: hypothetical protein AWU57_290 [Marinobacter sp. T13-3]
MSIADYAIAGRDRFEAEETPLGLAFPCSACRYRHGSDQEQPCAGCDHNTNAAPPSRQQGEKP